jgi:hypothetical protein
LWRPSGTQHLIPQASTQHGSHPPSLPPSLKHTHTKSHLSKRGALARGKGLGRGLGNGGAPPAGNGLSVGGGQRRAVAGGDCLGASVGQGAAVAAGLCVGVCGCQGSAANLWGMVWGSVLGCRRSRGGTNQARHACVASMCQARAHPSVPPPQPLTAVASLFAMAVPRPVAAAWELARAVPPLAALALAVATAVASSLRPAKVGGEEGCSRASPCLMKCSA